MYINLLIYKGLSSYFIGRINKLDELYRFKGYNDALGRV